MVLPVWLGNQWNKIVLTDISLAVFSPIKWSIKLIKKKWYFWHQILHLRMLVHVCLTKPLHNSLFSSMCLQVWGVGSEGNSQRGRTSILTVPMFSARAMLGNWHWQMLAGVGGLIPCPCGTIGLVDPATVSLGTLRNRRTLNVFV